MSDTDVTVAGEVLQRALGRVREVQPAHRATLSALHPDEYDDVGEATLPDARAIRWYRVVPSRFHHAAVEHFAPDVGAQLREWGTAPGARNLVLFGPVGVGKTHAALAAARLPFDRGLEVRFLPVIELLDLLRPGGPEGSFYALADTDVLVLDDLGSERPTDWTAERLYALINRRWLEQVATVATTNLDPAELEAALGKRVFSRLIGNDAVVLRLAGPDRRRQR